MNASVDNLNANADLTHIEVDTIGEILNISMGAAATAISVMLNRQVSITTPVVQLIKKDNFDYGRLEPVIGVEINYIEGFNGANLLIMSIDDVKKIVSSLLGESDIGVNSSELDEMHNSALGEVMNQMMGSASTALATFFDKSINISPPKIIEPNAFYESFFSAEVGDSIATVSFKFVIDGLIDSQFVTVLPISFVKEMVSNAMNMDGSGSDENKVQADYGNLIGHTQIPRPIYANEATPSSNVKSQQSNRRGGAPPQRPKEHKKNVNVQPVQFDNFDEDESENNSPDQLNLDLVMGVEVNVTVEIGHAKKMVKDVLNITKGSIIELDKQAGDPVDVIVNGQLIAKGDVVVVDDYFGVRITKVLNDKK
ncbi:MAG: flagellar motor switch protein FliN [Clostridiales bacterium GWF2_36_10]|nr:MAG: flagellar motor switch protein FliN [Clostridiales bacterium GWF2_36_10]HAN20850.1 flagellar motor switch phosphatase FliY [Clostridiales bacterium]